MENKSKWYICHNPSLQLSIPKYKKTEFWDYSTLSKTSQKSKEVLLLRLNLSWQDAIAQGWRCFRVEATLKRIK